MPCKANHIIYIFAGYSCVFFSLSSSSSSSPPFQWCQINLFAPRLRRCEILFGFFFIALLFSQNDNYYSYSYSHFIISEITRWYDHNLGDLKLKSFFQYFIACFNWDFQQLAKKKRENNLYTLTCIFFFLVRTIFDNSYIKCLWIKCILKLLAFHIYKL